MFQVRVEMMVPSLDCNVSTLCYSKFSDAYFLFINNRPVRNKQIERVSNTNLYVTFKGYNLLA